MERNPSSSKAGCHCAVGGQLFGKLPKVPSIFGYGMGSHIKTKRQREKRRMGRNSPALSPFIWSGFWNSNPWRCRKHHNQGEASQRVLDPLFHLEFAKIAHKRGLLPGVLFFYSPEGFSSSSRDWSCFPQELTYSLGDTPNTRLNALRKEASLA